MGPLPPNLLKYPQSFLGTVSSGWAQPSESSGGTTSGSLAELGGCVDSEGEGVHSGSFSIAAGPLHRPAAPESRRSGGHLGTDRHLAGAESVQPGPQKKAESPSRRPGERHRHLTANPAPRQAPPLSPVTRGPALDPAPRPRPRNLLPAFPPRRRPCWLRTSVVCAGASV